MSVEWKKKDYVGKSWDAGVGKGINTKGGFSKRQRERK